MNITNKVFVVILISYYFINKTKAHIQKLILVFSIDSYIK